MDHDRRLWRNTAAGNLSVGRRGHGKVFRQNPFESSGIHALPGHQTLSEETVRFGEQVHLRLCWHAHCAFFKTKIQFNCFCAGKYEIKSLNSRTKISLSERRYANPKMVPQPAAVMKADGTRFRKCSTAKAAAAASKLAVTAGRNAETRPLRAIAAILKSHLSVTSS